MSTEIKTIVGQLSIAGGSWRGDAPNQVAVREPESTEAPGAGKGDLFVLVEVRGPVSNRDKVEHQLAETIRDTYYLARGSITASLRRALQEGGAQLYHHNQQVGEDQKIMAGVAAVVIRDEDAFVAQAGPAAVYAVLSNFIRRYPARSPWLDEAPTGAIEPDGDQSALGRRELVDANLHHLQVSPNDVIILADSRLAGQLPLNDVISAVSPHNVKATTKRLGKVAKARNCSALVLSAVEAESPLDTLKRNTPEVLKPGPASPLRRLFKRRRNEPDARPTAETIADEPPLEMVADPDLAAPAETMASQSQSSRFFSRQPAFSQKPAEIKEQQPDRDSYREPAEVPEVYYEPEEQISREEKVLASVAHEPGFAPHWREQSSSFSAAKILRGLGSGLLMLVALLGAGLKNVLLLILSRSGSGHSPRQAGAHVHRQQPSVVSWRVLRNIAIAIPLLVAVIVGVNYLQKGRMIEAEYQGFVESAQAKFQQAQAVTATDPATALGLMSEAETALVEAEKIKADQPEIAELRQKMAVVADEVGNVQRLYYLPQLRQYTDPNTSLKRIVVQGVEVYVLDTGNDRVFHHRLDDVGETLLPDDEASLVLVSRGQRVDDITVGDILDMVWMPAGGNRQTSDLVMLNSTGLLENNPSWGNTTAALAGGDLLGLPVAVSSFFGNFYILDPQANRLLRYLPTADGYSDPPEDYFPADQAVDLTNTVDLAIDGAVYVLFRDGRLSKFEGGRPVEFELTGLDKPFNNPVSVFTAPDEQVQTLYVADAGNQRIVQLEKDGRFIRQFKPRKGEAVSFANLQDIYVDEIGGRLYILDSNNLYVGNIPTETVE